MACSPPAAPNVVFVLGYQLLRQTTEPMSHSYQFKLATTPAELKAYFDLRRATFVDDQQLLADHDTDDFD